MLEHLHLPLSLAALAALVPAMGARHAVLSGQQISTDIVLILLDDIGVDVLDDDVGERSDLPGFYSIPDTSQAIDELLTHGIRFTHAWVNDVCSPTRSNVHTGRYSFRHGIGSQILPDNDVSLPASELLLPEMLELALGDGAYQTAVFGKWHMQSDSTALSAAVDAGYEYFEGTLFAVTGIGGSYCNGYTKIVHAEGGQPQTTTVGTFVQADQVDSCANWIGSQPTGSTDPALFVYLPLQAPYELHKVPETSLFTVDPAHYPRMASLDLPPTSCGPCQGLAGGSPVQFQRECFTAMVEAVDTKLAELLDILDARAQARSGDPGARWWDTTTVILLGDNGSPDNGVISTPFPANQGKNTAFNGGVQVPLYIAGSAVDSVAGWDQVSDSLVNGVDLFATIAAIAGVFDGTGYTTLNDLPGQSGIVFDAVDLSPVLAGPTVDVRDWIFSESWAANTDQVPYVNGEDRVILGRYDDGTGDGSLGLYKLWVTPPQPFTEESIYASNGLYYGDRFYEISVDDGILVDEFESQNLVNAHPDALSLAQRDAYFGLRTQLRTLMGW